MDSLKPYTLDPFLYEIEAGKSELMTSLTSPILADGQFIGFVGVDINLPVVQTWLETVQGIESINDSIAQVATAAEEQSAVSDELSERVTLISDGSLQLSELGKEIKTLSVSSTQLIDSMNKELNKFTV